ncbi:uncharacterized protein LOC107637965 [Arachis ipaensis]|uniref:uncharacterized protein LOC107637965 n=1 Tax=Arachis ipaensis TaxID=130454 RepID=UPI0007AF81A1|nr:uncharacterized protein LOC107637965 [Arachis ipaensis]
MKRREGDTVEQTVQERELPSARRHHRVRGEEEEREREEEAVAVDVRASSSLPFVNQTMSPSEAPATAKNLVTVRSIASPLGASKGEKKLILLHPLLEGEPAVPPRLCHYEMLLPLPRSTTALFLCFFFVTD